MKTLLLAAALALTVTAAQAERVVQDTNGKIIAIYNDAGQQVYSAQSTPVYTQEPQVVYVPQTVVVREPYYSVAPIIVGAAIIGSAAYFGGRYYNHGGYYRPYHHR